jgi:hypothetical protein
MKKNPLISSPLPCAGLVVTVLLAMSSMASAQTTVFQDNMEGGSGGLNGRTVSPTAQVGASNQWWGSQSGQTGTQLSVGNTTATFGKAAAGFDDALLAPGTTSFTMTTSWSIDDATWVDTGSNIYFGFGNASGDGRGTGQVTPPTNGFYDNQLAFGFKLSGDFTGTSATIKAGVGSNPSDYSASFTRSSDSVDWAGDFQITYDILTSMAYLSFKNTGNGETAFTQLAAVSYTGDIGGLWFKADSLPNSAHAGFLFDDITVTAVPESSSSALIAGVLGLACVVIRRR